MKPSRTERHIHKIYPIVITAPLTESTDHAGHFIQMALASIPTAMERFIDKKYPNWRELKRSKDGFAKVAPASVRALERVLRDEFGEEASLLSWFLPFSLHSKGLGWRMKREPPGRWT